MAYRPTAWPTGLQHGVWVLKYGNIGTLQHGLCGLQHDLHHGLYATRPILGFYGAYDVDGTTRKTRSQAAACIGETLWAAAGAGAAHRLPSWRLQLVVGRS